MSDSTSVLAGEENVPGDAGQLLFVRTWRPHRKPTAVILITPGLNAHSGLYDWAGRQLATSGYAVVVIDLRGRGRSTGERYLIASIDDYASDVATVMQTVKHRYPNTPVFLMGHSAGGVVACIYALGHQAELAGLICESFAYRVPAPALAIAVVRMISRLLPRLPVLNLRNEDFSRDSAVVGALNEDPLILNETQPAATVAALARAANTLRRKFQALRLPILILHGQSDKITLPAGSEEFFNTAGSSDKTLKIYTDHVHDLLADIGKEEVMRDLQMWIAARLNQEGA